MKKIALFCVAALCSGVSLATSNYSSSTGIVVIPDVNVNGTTLFESVTLQLNANGTWAVLNAKAKNKTISDTPIDTLTTENFDIGLLGCATTGTNEITCNMRVVNNQLDRDLFICSSPVFSCDENTSLFDDLNNVYKPSSITFTNKTGSNNIGATLIQGVPANISMTFKGIDIRAKSISAFKPGFVTDNNRIRFEGNFKNVKF